MLNARLAGRETEYFAGLRAREFARLDRDDVAYLDYTGAALFGESQVTRHHALLASQLFANPHADSGPSRASTDMLHAARAEVLRFLDADPDDYAVVFTANASAAAKLVAESFPFSRASALVLSADNHNSINGVREFARRSGVRTEYVALDDQLRLRGAEHVLRSVRRSGPRLFAFPAQSNFSGVRHSLALIESAQREHFDVLLDAAAFVATSRMSLRAHRPEFVVLSCYKIFGYPTGLGALVARVDALRRLRRPWFAGGTVDYASIQNDVHQLRDLAGGFEDGTPNFLGASAVGIGFSFLREIGAARIAARSAELTRRLIVRLGQLRHPHGESLVRVYGPMDLVDRGPTVAFNVLDRWGRVVRYDHLERCAREARIVVRGGCFCNPGASEFAFGFERDRTRECLSAVGGKGFSVERFSDCLGDRVAVGAVRASVGIATSESDVDRLIALVATFAEGVPNLS